MQWEIICVALILLPNIMKLNQLYGPFILEMYFTVCRYQI